MVSFWDKNRVLRYASIDFLERFKILNKNCIGELHLEELLGPLFENHLPYLNSVMDGKPKVFEQNLNSHIKGLHSCIITYYPDKKDKQIVGFYLQVLEKQEVDLLDPELMMAINQFNNILNAPAAEKVDQTVKQVEEAIDPQIQKVAEYLKLIVLMDFPGLALIAETHCMSVSKLKRDFKLAYGVSPFIYYRKLQMDIAEQYLKEKKYRIGELATIFNFSNPYNFTACYKRLKNNSINLKFDFASLVLLLAMLTPIWNLLQSDYAN
jgi:AraC-like DNA-binding protein